MVGADTDKLVASDRRAQLQDKLHKLNEAVYEVEKTKVVLLSDLTRSKGSQAETRRVESIAVELTGKIRELERRIDDVAVELREQYKKDGLNCQVLLSKAAGERKQWVFDLAESPKMILSPERRTELIQRGQVAVDNLRNASLELATLTMRLQ